MEVWIWNIPRSDPLQGTFFVLEVEPWNIPDSNLRSLDLEYSTV